MFPENLPGPHDTSFRLFQRPIKILGLVAYDPYVGRRTNVTFRFELSSPLRSHDELQITAPSSFTLHLSPLTVPVYPPNARAFPVRENKLAAPWIIQYGVSIGAEASVPYVLTLGVTNPPGWGGLDRDFNFWTLETFYKGYGVLNKRSRRDAGVAQGYPVKGELLGCQAVEGSLAREDETWASLAFQLNEPVLYHVFTRGNPSQLALRLPNGFKFAAFPTGGDCSALVSLEARADSPPLRAAQFPHATTPLSALSGFNCTLDSSRLTVARTLTMEVVEQESFGLLPELPTRISPAAPTITTPA